MVETGLLQYDEAVRPFNKSVGSVEMDYIEGKSFIQTQTMNLISSALSDLELEIRSRSKKGDRIKQRWQSWCGEI